MPRWFWILLVVALLALAGGAAAPTVRRRILNGARLGRATKPGPDGIIRVSPAELALAAGFGGNVDAYSLARMMSSEHGSQPDAYLRAVGWAVRNKARERGISITTLLTDGNGVKGDGYYGEQKAAAGTKYAATGQDPHERHGKIAREVIAAPQSDDTSDGATHFYSPRVSDFLADKAANGTPAEREKYKKYLGRDAAAVDKKWRAPGGLYATGAAPVAAAGLDPRELTLYRRIA